MRNGNRQAQKLTRAKGTIGQDIDWAMRSLTWIFQRLFKLDITDTLSGYRVMSRRFVKSLPSRAVGFEIEAELNAHSAVMDVNVAGYTNSRCGPPVSATRQTLDRPRWYEDFAPQPPTLPDARPSLAFTLLSVPWFFATIWVCLRGLAQLRPSRDNR